MAAVVLVLGWDAPLLGVTVQTTGVETVSICGKVRFGVNDGVGRP